MESYSDRITHRDGPSGRRAALVGGPDVWEVVTTEPDVVDREERIRAVAEYLTLSVEQVRATFEYYDDHRREIDEWISKNRHVADEAYAKRRHTRRPSPR